MSRTWLASVIIASVLTSLAIASIWDVEPTVTDKDWLDLKSYWAQVKTKAPRTAMLAGAVLDENGKPASRAVILLLPIPKGTTWAFSLNGLMARQDWFVSATATRDGRFRISVAPDDYQLVVVSADRSRASVDAIVGLGGINSVTNIELKLRRVLRIEGRAESSQVGFYTKTRVDFVSGWPEHGFVINAFEEPEVDAGGRFHASVLSTGRYNVAVGVTNMWLLNERVEITDSTRRIVLGGKFPGTVRGRLQCTDVHPAGFPVVLSRKGIFSQRQTLADADGRFEFIDVPPGEYGVGVSWDRNEKVHELFDATGAATMTTSGAPVSVELKVDRYVFPKPGSLAPDFEFTDLEGRKSRLSELRGKILLLDFWATWCGPCREEIPNLKELAKRFGSREDFVLLSVSYDESEAKLREFVAKQSMTWRHAWCSNVVFNIRYGGALPTTYLIGKDGRVLRVDLRGPSVVSDVAAALEQ